MNESAKDLIDMIGVAEADAEKYARLALKTQDYEGSVLVAFSNLAVSHEIRASRLEARLEEIQRRARDITY